MTYISKQSSKPNAFKFLSLPKLKVLLAALTLVYSVQPAFGESGRMYSVSENKPFPIPATTVLLFPCGKVNPCESLAEPLKAKDDLSVLMGTTKQQFMTATDINGQFNYKCPESECLVYARGSDEKNTYIWASIIKKDVGSFELTPLNSVMALPIVRVQSYLCKGGPAKDDKKLGNILESWNGCSIGDFMAKTGLVPDTQGAITLPTGEQGYFYKLVLKKDGDIFFGNPFQYNSCTISLLTTSNGVIVGSQARTKGNDVISGLFGENSRICKRALKGKNW
jgi:hypothetical protein